MQWDAYVESYPCQKDHLLRRINAIKIEFRMFFGVALILGRSHSRAHRAASGQLFQHKIASPVEHSRKTSEWTINLRTFDSFHCRQYAADFSTVPQCHLLFFA